MTEHAVEVVANAIPAEMTPHGIHARCAARDILKALAVAGYELTREWDLDPATGCWNWLGYISKYGYGQLNRDGEHRAARWYYKRYRGELAVGLQIDHLCRNRACVNPDHLEAVTPALNAQRRGSSKLDWQKVNAIRSSSESAAALAARFGIAEHTVQGVLSFRTWCPPGQVPINRSRAFTDDEYEAIYQRWLGGESLSGIARSLGKSVSGIHKIVRRLQSAAA